MEKTKQVKILLHAVGSNLSKVWNQNPSLVSELTEKALDAWNNRDLSKNKVRFLHQLPTKYGSHFRFFTVTEQHDGSLLISRGGSDGTI